MLLALLAFTEQESYARPGVQTGSLYELTLETLSRTEEFTRAQAAIGASKPLFLYGQSSLELLRFVRNKVAELGGVAQYRDWLAKEGVHILDWHRIGEPLEMIIHAPDTDIANFRRQLDSALPPGTFHAGVELKSAAALSDAQSSTDLLKIALGVGDIPPAGTDVTDFVEDSRKGAALFYNNLQDFNVTNELLARSPEEKIQVVLDWLRILSEDSALLPREKMESEIAKLISHLKEKHRTAIQNLFKEGRTFRRVATNSAEQATKTLEALQMYAKDSAYTRDLLGRVGLLDLMSPTDRNLRIFKALSGEGARALSEEVKPVRVYHASSLAGSQNIESGALLVADGNVIIGESTAQVEGVGLYTTTVPDDYGGLLEVELLLDPKCESLGHCTRLPQPGGKDWYLINSMDAILVDASGKPQIRVPGRMEKVREAIELLAKAASGEFSDDNRIRNAMKRIAILLSPENYPKDREIFNNGLEIVRKIQSGKYENELIQLYLSKGGVISQVRGNAEFALIDAKLGELLAANDSPPNRIQMAFLRESVLSPGLFTSAEDVAMRSKFIDIFLTARNRDTSIVADDRFMQALREVDQSAFDKMVLAHSDFYLFNFSSDGDRAFLQRVLTSPELDAANKRRLLKDLLFFDDMDEPFWTDRMVQDSFADYLKVIDTEDLATKDLNEALIGLLMQERNDERARQIARAVRTNAANLDVPQIQTILQDEQHSAARRGDLLTVVSDEQTLAAKPELKDIVVDIFRTSTDADLKVASGRRILQTNIEAVPTAEVFDFVRGLDPQAQFDFLKGINLKSLSGIGDSELDILADLYFRYLTKDGVVDPSGTMDGNNLGSFLQNNAEGTKKFRARVAAAGSGHGISDVILKRYGIGESEGIASQRAPAAPSGGRGDCKPGWFARFFGR